MLTVAYLANQFPAAVEPYVSEEIEELRRRGVQVIPGSVRRPDVAQRESAKTRSSEPTILSLQPIQVRTLLRALGLAGRRWKQIAGSMTRVLLVGKEPPVRRVKALLHTRLGAQYAVRLHEDAMHH